MAKKTVQAAITTGMMDSKRGRCAAHKGNIRTETTKGISQRRKPNRPAFMYLFIFKLPHFAD